MRIANVTMVLPNGHHEILEYPNAWVRAHTYVGFTTPFEIRVEFNEPVNGTRYINHPIGNVLRYWNSIREEESENGSISERSEGGAKSVANSPS